MAWRLLPEKFMPVQLKKKNVENWDDLERIRAQHAPVLGEDDWWETAKYNFTSFVFCDLMSKAFAWVFISTGLLLYLTYQDANHPTWEMGSLTTWFVWGNEVGALLHFAAKDEFKKVINAACSRWGGPNQNPIQVSALKPEKKEVPVT
jgi:hypothetical protein